ncbi:NAD-dependent epimerase/dehydratase family protein [Myxococcus sp. CA051A]|uniref:NAD-dependent epimerase/dehydratase family protein n=1 Tax=unclassified Myxococcus TaxID=2648731 RepID=UPI00157B4F99|nr:MULTISPECIES: NAD-dependent epimerase/dehydratase family protein [unclassified Myxococcus]NTX12956.1 NAD-dependent epimerase/dehydratase family protein [Myxococcus sp. CA056]NTX64900.1 NAD-dependent epimerase/dehydratase family protein [Myxococcus sp. CA051A]
MKTSRRKFLQYSAAGASLLALGPEAMAASKKGAKKRILILGGTGFLGPAVVEAAKARGHSLTLFNRGKTRPELFPDVEKLRGDRDPDKDEGLKALKGRKWDAVVDTSGYYPRMVRASAGLLAPNVKQYVFISSVSAYASDKTPREDESGPTATLADPTVESMGKDYEFYGGLKRACEEAAEAAFPGRVANIRPGYIVGPDDRSDRFTYWPVRFDKGGEMLAPGTPKDPLQIIDVRDLAEWLVLLIEGQVNGVFNAVGPAEPWSMGAMLDTCRQVTGRDTKVTWVPAEFLEKQGETGDVRLPIYMPPAGTSLGTHLRSNAKAVKAGLKFRPVDVTVRDTLAYFKGLPEERRNKPRAGLPAEREAELLALWRKARAPEEKPAATPAPAASGKGG